MNYKNIKATKEKEEKIKEKLLKKNCFKKSVKF